jgi:hypothetical protein
VEVASTYIYPYPDALHQPKSYGIADIILQTHPTMAQPCEGCTCGRANGDEPIQEAIETTREVRSFTSSSEPKREPTEGIELAVPLRSKDWFGNVDDPGECEAQAGAAGVTRTTADDCFQHSQP